MALEGFDKWFTSCDSAKDPEKYSKDVSGLRGIVFRNLDGLAKEKKGKTILRAACIRYLGTIPEVQAALKKGFDNVEDAVHRIHMYTGQWAKKRKIKVSGDQGSKKFTF
jgi:hypothetical protein